MERVFRDFVKAVLSGFMIGIGGTVYLSCSNKIVGAFLFTIGLITICEFGFNPRFQSTFFRIPAKVPQALHSTLPYATRYGKKYALHPRAA